MENDNIKKCIDCLHTFEKKPNNFSELLKKYDKILIPKIQRDYAQGRDEPHANEVRENFLSAIFNSNKLELELDFIYGYVTKKYVDSDIKNCFIPLDGQQRLTTLFLLYLYFNKEINLLKNFTYETRQSSKNFCKLLVENRDSIFEIINNNNKPSEVIKDSGWFFGIWVQDPTIKSMLNMLDAIHERANKKEFNEINLNNITFKFLNMGEHNLADDLYIKMNSRGKPLTHFENFKVSIEKHLDSSIKDDENFIKDWKNKIDNQWTQFFWDYKENYLVDAPFMRFINRVLGSYSISLEKPINDLNENDNIKDLLESKSNIYISQEIYTNILKKKEDFEYLYNILNLVVGEKKKEFEEFKIFKNLTFNIIKKFVSDECTYKDRAYFYALSNFLLKNKRCEEKPDHWIRFIRNIIEGENISNKEQFIRFIKFIDSHLNDLENKDIYEYLKDLNKYTGSFEKQMNEEILKAELILSQEKTADNKTWEVLIIEAENHSLFRGRITFLLKKIENDNLENLSGGDIELFEKKCEKVLKINFDYNNNQKLITIVLSLCKNIPWEIDLKNWKSLLDKPDIQYGIIKLLDNYKQELSNNFVENNDWRNLLFKNPEIINNKPFLKWSNAETVNLKRASGTWTKHDYYISKQRDEFLFSVKNKLNEKLRSENPKVEAKIYEFKDNKNKEPKLKNKEPKYLTTEWNTVAIPFEKGNFKTLIAITTHLNRIEIGLRKWNEDKEIDQEIKTKCLTYLEKNHPKLLEKYPKKDSPWYYIENAKDNVSFSNHTKYNPEEYSEELINLYEAIKGITIN